jgi:hypothetical protein
MAEPNHSRLIEALAADLRPVRRLRAPWLRAAGWTAFIAIVGSAIAAVTGIEATQERLSATPDLRLAAIGSTLTAILAAWAAFATSVPSSNRRWALAPLPALALWIGASGFGCLRPWLAPETRSPAMSETGDCLLFILGISLPLSAIIFVMLSRAMPLQPSLTAGLGGLAAAAAAATLLNLVHPFDAAFLDLAVHALAVALVVAASRWLGGSYLWRRAGP